MKKYLDAARRRRAVHEWMNERHGTKIDVERLETIKRRGLRKSAHYAKYKGKKSELA